MLGSTSSVRRNGFRRWIPPSASPRITRRATHSTVWHPIQRPPPRWSPCGFMNRRQDCLRQVANFCRTAKLGGAARVTGASCFRILPDFATPRGSRAAQGAAARRASPPRSAREQTRRAICYSISPSVCRRALEQLSGQTVDALFRAVFDPIGMTRRWTLHALTGAA